MMSVVMVELIKYGDFESMSAVTIWWGDKGFRGLLPWFDYVINDNQS